MGNGEFIERKGKTVAAGRTCGKVTYGQQVQIMFKQGQWYQIATENGKIGWVSSEYIAAVSPTASQWVKVLYNDVNIRSAPSLDGNIKTTAQ